MTILLAEKLVVNESVSGKNMLTNKIKVVISLLLFVLLNGCASTKIVIPSYTAPQEFKKISEIESGGEVPDGAYLALAIDPDVSGKGINDKQYIGENLISSIKGGITQTNFITLYPIFDEAYVQLNMKIVSYNFTGIDAELQVTFTLTKGMTEYLSKTYSSSITQRSSKNKTIQDIAKRVADMFIGDITPIKTNQLREFKSMPSELDYILTYAKRGNFESAISDMEAYKSKKDSGFYYNLAVLCEALGSETGDIKLFVKADDMYRQSMQLGGSDDDMIVNTKARFDKFYRLFKMAEKQRKANKALSNELNDQYGGAE